MNKDEFYLLTKQDAAILASRAKDQRRAYLTADIRDQRVMLDAATVIPSAGAHHRVWAGYGLSADEYREAFT